LRNEDEMGELSVLNVGAGDIKVTFNHLDSAESAKAIKMLMDMRDRGYAILVETEDGYTRAVDIDASRGRYIIQIAGDAPLPADAEEVTPTKKNGRRGRRVSVPIAGRRATGVARSAGG
jgi:hypothetical protein